MLSLKSVARDGKTPVHSLRGVGLVVSAVAFNELFRDFQILRDEEVLRVLRLVAACPSKTFAHGGVSESSKGFAWAIELEFLEAHGPFEVELTDAGRAKLVGQTF